MKTLIFKKKSSQSKRPDKDSSSDKLLELLSISLQDLVAGLPTKKECRIAPLEDLRNESNIISVINDDFSENVIYIKFSN